MKAGKKIWDIFGWIFVICVSVLAVLLVGVRLIGLKPYTVLSGSMEPVYHVGSLIYVKSAAPEDIKVGDPITFILNKNLDIATHRVVSIDTDKQYFQTKGDANNAEDSTPVHFENLVGTPVFTIPYLGYFSNWISHPPGLYIGISVLFSMVVLIFLPDMLRRAEAADRRSRNQELKQKES